MSTGPNIYPETSRNRSSFSKNQIFQSYEKSTFLLLEQQKPIDSSNTNPFHLNLEEESHREETGVKISPFLKPLQHNEKKYTNLKIKKLNLRKSLTKNTSHINKNKLLVLSDSSGKNIYSPFYRSAKVDYLIEKVEKEEKRNLKIIEKSRQLRYNNKEEFIERQDSVIWENLEEAKQKKFIKEFLKSKNFNDEINNDAFYHKYENKVNYLSDIYQVPNISNHIFTMPNKNSHTSTHERMNLLKYSNALDKGTTMYLNTLKRKYQKEKDVLTEAFRREYKAEDNQFDTKIQDSYKQFYDFTKEKLDNINNYEYNDYFNYKYEQYDGVSISDNRERNTIFSIKTEPKNPKFLEKILNLVSKAEVDTKMLKLENNINNFMSKMK
jgi:hypothetical protein